MINTAFKTIQILAKRLRLIAFLSKLKPPLKPELD